MARLADALPIQGIGVDIALNALQRAKQAVKQPNVSFVACDSVHLPFPNETFDAVVCSELLEHVPEYGRLLSELARVLRRNGLLYATMPNSLKSVWRPLRGTCRLIDDGIFVDHHWVSLSRISLNSVLDFIDTSTEDLQ